MGIFNFIQTRNIAYLCAEFNKMSMKQWYELSRSFFRQYEELDPDYFIKKSDHEIAIMAAVFWIADNAKLNNRYEFKNYSSSRLCEISEGRLELLGFIGLHQGQQRMINHYIKNDSALVHDCQIIYDYVKHYSPDAITLQPHYFYQLAALSLYKSK